MTIYDTRIEMIKTLPTDLIIAELGVFKGDFAKIIYDELKPSILVLIDLWEDKIIGSGDQDGNNMEKHNGLELYSTVTKKFINNSNVKIYRENTSFLNTFTDNYFDAIYIDADHSFNGCLSDLMLSYDKIKDGGYIMGHDYGQNMVKSTKEYNFGVYKAVNTFCREKKQKISAIANDGCKSYLIKVSK